MKITAKLSTLASILAAVLCFIVGAGPWAAPALAADYLVGAKPGPYVVGLSNSFSGNSWRAQMVAEFKQAADNLKADGTLKDYIVSDATGNTASQIQQIQNMIAAKVDAIVIDANSETALNPAIEAAHKAGIIVVAFDNTVTSPHAINVSTDQRKFGEVGGEWLAKKLNGKGNIIVLSGLAGSPVNKQRWDEGAKKALSKYPDIKILTEVNADWDQAKGQQAVANLLPSFPKIDGVYSQGGAMTLGAIYAFKAANRPLVPMVGEANNGLLKVWKAELKNGFSAIAPSNPCGQSVDALQVALKALKGENIEKEISQNPPTITDDTLDKFVQPDLPDSLWLPTTLDAAHLQALFGTAK
jgi:ribose transport system substrate-binding protein